MNAPLLKLEGVNTHIGPYHILHGVDLQVPRGQLTMLLGRNGAGKSTALRTIMGLWQASAGKITFDGQDITKKSTPDISQAGIAYVPENMGIFSDLTVRENMLIAARHARNAEDIDQKRLDWMFSLFPAMKKFWEHPAGKLSGGQKQMLAVSRAIVEPRKLLADRRAQQGPGAGNHRQHDLGLPRTQADRYHDPAGGTELQLCQAAGRHGGRDG